MVPDHFESHHYQNIHSRQPVSGATTSTLLQRNHPATSYTQAPQILDEHSSNLTHTTRDSQGLSNAGGVGSQNETSIQPRPNHSSPRHSADNIEVINSNPSNAQRDAKSAIAFRPRDLKVDQDGSLTYNPTFVGPTTHWEKPPARFVGQRVSTWQYIKNKCKERVGRAWRKMSRRKREAEYEDFIRTVEVIFPVNDHDVKHFGRALFDTGNKYNLISRSFAEMYGIITESKPGEPILELPGGHTYTSIQKMVGRFAAQDRNIPRKELWFDPMFIPAEFHVSDKIERYDIIIGMDTIVKYKLVEFRPLGFTGFRRKPASFNSAELKEYDKQQKEAQARNVELKKAHEEQKALKMKRVSETQKSNPKSQLEPEQ